jgi:hypothetical protein
MRRDADDIAVQAEDLRREADRVAHAAETVAWHSVAADAMRAQMRERAGEIRGAATRFDDAAAALRAHAAEVEERLELIAAIENKVRGLVAGAWDRAGDIAGKVVDALTPDELFDEELRRFDPPPPGHKDWLSVPNRLGI